MAGKPAAWAVDLAGSATCDRDTTVVHSGLASVKYVNPDNSTNSGWHGIQQSDPVRGNYCLALRPGSTYRIRVASRTNRIAGGQKYRMFIYFDVGQTISLTNTFTYKAVDTWQVDEWVFTVPLTAEPLSTFLLQFNRNGDGTSTTFWADSLRMIEQEIGGMHASQLANVGRFDCILNGDFEDGLAFWGRLAPNTGTIAIETGGNVYKGAKTLALQVSSTTPAAVVQTDDFADVPQGNRLFTRVEPGEKLFLSVTAKNGLGPTIPSLVQVILYDDLKANPVNPADLSSLTWTETVFTTKSGIFTVTAGKYYLSIEIIAGTRAAGDTTFYVDEIHIWRGRDIPTAYLEDLAVTSAKLAKNISLGTFDNGSKAVNFTINWNNGNNQLVTLAASGLVVTLTNPVEGALYTLEIQQDGTGSRTLPTLPAAVHWPSGTAPVLSTGASKIDAFTLHYRGGVYYANTYGLNYA